MLRAGLGPTTGCQRLQDGPPSPAPTAVPFGVVSESRGTRQHRENNSFQPRQRALCAAWGPPCPGREPLGDRKDSPPHWGGQGRAGRGANGQRARVAARLRGTLSPEGARGPFPNCSDPRSLCPREGCPGTPQPLCAGGGLAPCCQVPAPEHTGCAVRALGCRGSGGPPPPASPATAPCCPSAWAWAQDPPQVLQNK